MKRYGNTFIYVYELKNGIRSRFKTETGRFMDFMIIVFIYYLDGHKQVVYFGIYEIYPSVYY